MSKAEIIKTKNKERLEKNKILDEIEKINNCDLPLGLDIRTEIGKYFKSLKCLKYFYTHKHIKEIFDIWYCYESIYIQVLDNIKKSKSKNKFSKEHLSIDYENILIKTYEIFLKKTNNNKIYYLMEKMGSYIYPLNFTNYYQKELILDNWQCNALDMIDKKLSILLCAPTSSGKTFLTLYLLKKHKNIIFIVPTLPLALQVASLFYHNIQNDLWIIDENLIYKSGNNPEIIIGTPKSLEKYIDQINLTEITALVVDEIHEISLKPSIERLIHIILKQEQEIQFLGLSATISNQDNFLKWLINFDKSIKLISVQDRYFNLSRFHYDNQKDNLNRLSPLHTINNLDLDHDDIIHNFTPNDTIHLYNEIKKFDNTIINPNLFFDKLESPLKLKDCKIYSNYLMKQLLNNSYKTDLLLKTHNEFNDMEIDNNINIYNLCQTLSKEKKTPAILFNLDDNILTSKFKELIKTFEQKEIEQYPKYYKELEKHNKEFNTKMEEREKIIKKFKNENKRIEWEMDNPPPDLPPQIGQPHQDFVIPIKNINASNDSIIDVKTKLYKLYVKNNMKNQIPNLLELFNSLQRNIAIYKKDLPNEYLRLVQELMQQKKIAILFSDKELAFGINMPIKSVCFMGDSINLNNTLFQQMEGRAGRRGLDKEGNVIFSNITKKRILELTNGKLLPISGSKNIVSDYIFSMPEIPNKKKILKSLLKNNLYNFMNKEDPIKINIKEAINKNYKLNEKFQKLLWKLSDFDKSIKIIYFMKWFIDQKSLHKRFSECDDSFVFKLFYLIYFDNYSEIIDCQLQFKNQKEIICKESLLEYFASNDFLVKDFNKIDNNLFNYFKNNFIPYEIKSNKTKLSMIKMNIKNLKDIFLHLRNHFRETSMELILRKIWRRLFWLFKSISL